MFYHNTLHILIDLCFALAGPNLQTAVLCLTSHVSENWRSYFLALGLLLDTYGFGVPGILLVHTTGVETIDASIIALYCCRFSRLPAVLYNFLIFPRHLCSYKSLLLNDCLTPMSTVCFFSFLDYNNPLIITHFCSNE